MIIVEGPDGGGKTTLIPFLEALTGLPSWKPGPYPKSAREAYVHSQDCLHKLKQHFICDRVTQVSEHIYGPIVNDQDFMPLAEVQKFFRQCADNGWVFIYCRPWPTNLMIENHVRSENDESDEVFELLKERLGEIVKVYDSLMFSELTNPLRQKNLFYSYDWAEHGANHKLTQFLTKEFSDGQ